MQLSRDQKNEIARALVDGGVDPGECDLLAVLQDRKIQIIHRPSGSSFEAELQVPDANYILRGHVYDDPTYTSSVKPWTDLVERIQQWAEAMRHYENTPDLWAEASRFQEVLSETSADADADNSRFTAEERSQVAAQLDQIPELLGKAEQRASAEQVAQIQATVDDLKDASGRVGRKDWAMIFVGSVATQVLTGVMSSEQFQHIVLLTLTGLSHLFGGGPPQIPPMA